MSEPRNLFKLLLNRSSNDVEFVGRLEDMLESGEDLKEIIKQGNETVKEHLSDEENLFYLSCFAGRQQELRKLSLLYDYAMRTGKCLEWEIEENERS